MMASYLHPATSDRPETSKKKVREVMLIKNWTSNFHAHKATQVILLFLVPRPHTFCNWAIPDNKDTPLLRNSFVKPPNTIIILCKYPLICTMYPSIHNQGYPCTPQWAIPFIKGTPLLRKDKYVLGGILSIF